MIIFFFFLFLSTYSCKPSPSQRAFDSKKENISVATEKNTMGGIISSTRSKSENLALVTNEVRRKILASAQQDWIGIFNQLMLNNKSQWDEIHNHFTTSALKAIKLKHNQKIQEIKNMFIEKASGTDIYVDIQNLDLNDIIFYIRSKYGNDDKKFIEDKNTPFTGISVTLCQPGMIGRDHSMWFDTITENLGFYTLETIIAYQLSPAKADADLDKQLIKCDEFRLTSKPILFNQVTTILDPATIKFEVFKRSAFRTEITYDISNFENAVSHSAVYLNSDDPKIVSILEKNKFLGLASWKAFSPQTLGKTDSKKEIDTFYGRYFEEKICPKELLLFPGIANGAVTNPLKQLRGAALGALVAVDNAAIANSESMENPSCRDSERITVNINPVDSEESDGSSPDKRPNLVSPFDYSIEIDELIKLREWVDSKAIDVDISQ